MRVANGNQRGTTDLDVEPVEEGGAVEHGERVYRDGADVVLVSMPFGPLRQPSLGLSLLAATVPDVDCRIVYLTLPFAAEIGAELYDAIAHGKPEGTCLLGEWVFAESLDVAGSGAADDYFESVLRPAVPPATFEVWWRRALDLRRAAESFLDRCAAEIAALRPRLVGFTSVFQQHAASLALAGRLPEDVTVVFGGANCEGEMGWQTLKSFPAVDVVVSGEAEAVFPELVRRVLEGRPCDDLDGVVTRSTVDEVGPSAVGRAARVATLDALPRPSFETFFEQWGEHLAGASLAPRLLFETSRGCWWGEKQHCTFCGLNGLSMSFRSKSAERALDELAELVERYPGLSIMVVDNILDMAYFRDFLPALARRALGVKLMYEVKANLRKEQVRLLRDAGVLEIQPGIESLSDTVLSLMRKGTTALQNVQLLKFCAELGVWPSWHLIWGFPGEPPEDYASMADVLPLFSHLPPPNVAIPIRLDRFSPNFTDAEAMGFTGVRPVAAYAHVFPLAAEELARLAYYFDYDYRDERDPAEYTRDVAAGVRRWKKDYETSELFCLDRGAELWIWDLRPVARAPLHVLDGEAAALYRACDNARTLRRLAADLGVKPAEVDEIATPLIEAGLMLRDRERLLSLAILREGEPSLAEVGGEALSHRPAAGALGGRGGGAS